MSPHPATVAYEPMSITETHVSAVQTTAACHSIGTSPSSDTFERPDTPARQSHPSRPSRRGPPGRPTDPRQPTRATHTVRPARPHGRILAVLLGGAAALLVVAGCAAGPTGNAAGPPVTSSTTPAAEGASGATPQVRTVRIDYRGGRASGDTGTVSVARGETVRITLSSDVADEAHLHGYDRTAALTPGATATIEIVADIPGEFELELHEAGTQLATLQVR